MKKPNRFWAVREIDGTFVQLKYWNKQNLNSEDWNFSELEKFPTEMVRVAWLYEIDRELGSDNGPYLIEWHIHESEKAVEKMRAHADGTHPLSESEWKSLTAPRPKKSLAQMRADIKKMNSHIRARDGKRGKLLTDKEWEEMCPSWKPPIPKETELMLKSFDHHEFCEMEVPNMPGYRWVNGTSSYHCTIHPLEIDWMLAETELVEAFRRWLKHGEHSPFRPSYHKIASRSKVGKRPKISHLAWLEELAIYRISEAGFTRKEGLALLSIKHKSAANWEHAQARTRVRIEKEKERCEHSAWNQGSGSPKNWREWFVKPFRL